MFLHLPNFFCLAIGRVNLLLSEWVTGACPHYSIAFDLYNDLNFAAAMIIQVPFSISLSIISLRVLIFAVIIKCVQPLHLWEKCSKLSLGQFSTLPCTSLPICFSWETLFSGFYFFGWPNGSCWTFTWKKPPTTKFCFASSISGTTQKT